MPGIPSRTREPLRTIPAALADAAVQHQATDFTFIDAFGATPGGTESFTETTTHSFAQLDHRARQIAVALAELGLRKDDRVALVLPRDADFVPAFLGASHAGAVPVPLYPPEGFRQLGAYLGYCAHVVATARACALITTRRIKDVIGPVVGWAAPTSFKGVLPYDGDADLVGDDDFYRDPGLALADTAYTQFTSGSTSRPKGVVLTHANLAHNARAVMCEALNTDPDLDHGVPWLPLFHDMGLAFVIAPMMHRIPVTFMQPKAFLRRPARWLCTISERRATFTFAPTFAYAMAAKQIKDEELVSLDLSTLRIAGCGAEPIEAETLRAFARRFTPYGFREEAFMPGYGMVESTVGISIGRGINVERVLRDPLRETGRAVPALPDHDDEAVLEIVGCGRPFEGHELKIVHAQTREDLSRRRVGEILAKGPSVVPGYFEDPEKTRETFDPDGWLKTGDLGYLDEHGELFVCGRKKDLIIVHGINYYPQDLEWAASRVEGVRYGDVAAFAAHKPGLGGDAVVIVAGAQEVHPNRRKELAAAIRQEVQRTTGLVVDDVAIAETGIDVPKTSSGKVQRQKARALYESGELHHAGQKNPSGEPGRWGPSYAACSS